jgi:glutamate--cysteine ligase
LIPVDRNGRRIPVDGSAPGEPDGRTLLAAAASEGGWTCEAGAGGTPRFRIPGGGLFTFEPGGQIEVSTEADVSVDRIADSARSALRLLWAAADAQCVHLLTVGMDPIGRAEDVALVVDSERYRRQSAHYDRIGPWGRRMMRQSAAIHVNVDLGGRPGRRWSVANRAAAYLTAIFANSSRYQGEQTGFRSYRAEQWRRLDPSRTGLFTDEREPVGEYLSFALGARDFLGTAEGDPAPTFRESWASGASGDAWQRHLTTLFPEVRPRGYLELRSFDALRPAWLAVPMVVAAGLFYEPGALAEASALLPPPETGLLDAAGREGLAAPGIGPTALDLFDLALEGARRLGEATVSGRTLEEAHAFRERFTAKGRDPGHEGEAARDPFTIG